ncbi:MAG: AAA family ATPase [Planctomycetaceae bacterium]
MRIERITVCNIASLAGTHSVDFTKDPLRTTGLYSISGATGAGKSTLLDAMCLALFDKTPRLGQVPHKSEKVQDVSSAEDKGTIGQNETRTLLRRNTSQGFAEVAFVGVDQQQWTARWSVRRSRNHVDGRLQNVQRTLYHGHIAPGGEGRVAAQGKTAVDTAILEKVGLTFEQFTRAVLLAQNDFATFLKADDRQRAEILQALTGTEHFEEIGRAVFERYAAERSAVDTLETRLHGHQPLSEEGRAIAEAAEVSAAASVRNVESQVKRQESYVAWFTALTKLTNDGQTANSVFDTAVQQRDAAAERRLELKFTEETGHAARPLRMAERQAGQKLAAASSALESATEQRRVHTEILNGATASLELATAARQQTLQEQINVQPLLKQARELDARLQPLQTRVAKAAAARTSTTDAQVKAVQTLQAATAHRQDLLNQQQTLDQQREQLAAYIPFVDESAAWLHRLETARRAQHQLDDDHEELQQLTAELSQRQGSLDSQRTGVSELKQQCAAADTALQEARDVQMEFDADKLAVRRARCEHDHHVLTDFRQQLSQQQTSQESLARVIESLSDLQQRLVSDQNELKHVRDSDGPKARLAVDVSRQQLELITAAVDDHAQRLRLSLQPDQPCPVCGSAEHPYRNHAPDIAASAVNAAKEQLQRLEQQRDDLLREQHRLELTTATSIEQITELQQQQQELRRAISDIQWKSPEHPDVVRLLALAETDRIEAVNQRLAQIQQQRQDIASRETAFRASAKRVDECRAAAETLHRRLHVSQQKLAERETQCEVLRTRHAAAETACARAGLEFHNARDALGGLFSGLPNSKELFAADADTFRAQFEASTNQCRRMAEERQTLRSAIERATATIGPLEAAVQHATAALKDCEAEFAAATSEHDLHVRQRQQLLDGQPADEVERRLNERRLTVEKEVEDCVTARHQAATTLAASAETWKAAASSRDAATEALQAAQTALSQWLADFEQRSGQPCSVQTLDERLARGAAWIVAERNALQQLDEHVTAARSAAEVYQKQLQEHQRRRPTDDDEPVVLETLQHLQEELARSKEAHETARDIVRNDDQQRKQNRDLTQQLAAAQAAAEPWRKLNELIGSKDGHRFREIAQRRTLDVLLSDANHQLNQLSSRYRLERLPESLNLIVIDCDMGDERRSIHSLSGGESFLVSLALALGLASLTSNRLRIESLFIDEGFGSLDPETLTTAMHALTHLEAQGRKVGVISHVTEMSDAIPVQIKVVKRRSGGASRIVIPGADPAFVNPATEFEADSSSTAMPSTDIKALAQQVLEILRREQQSGGGKVSIAALRKETGCQPKDFRFAQSQLARQVVVDGRSLRLAESGPATYSEQQQLSLFTDAQEPA